MKRIDEIVKFWFAPECRPLWFAVNAEFDAVLRQRFLHDYQQAAAGALAGWEETAEGALALVLLLDQFPRNMFRGTPQAFATDAQALDVAEQAVGRGFDAELAAERRRFLYLPFEHSENVADQRRCVDLFERAGDDPDGLDWAVKHLRVIERFGRFPHRNEVLGRPTTGEERDFLQREGGF